MGRRGFLALAAALALPVVALGELALEAAVAARAVDDAAWDDVAEEAEALAREGDLIVVSPRWAEPHLRARLGDDTMPVAHLGRSDVDRFAAAVEVSLGGARGEELAAFRAVEEREVGPFVVRRLENQAQAPVLFDFVEAFRPPHASVVGTTPELRCTWSTRSRPIAGGLGGHPTLPAERFECPGAPWMGAGVTIVADQHFLPRRCIWAHPFASGEKILRFVDVPLDGARQLVGHHGMYWVIERDGLGADVTVDVRVDGASIGRAVHRDGDGWAPFAFDLPPAPAGAAEDATGLDGAQERTATIELAVSTSDADRRHLCVEATLR